MSEEVGPRAYRKRQIHAVRRRTGDDSIVATAIQLALVCTVAGTVFTAYMWALEWIGRLYSQLN